MDSRYQSELKCSGGRSGGPARVPADTVGWLAAVRVWASQPEGGSAESPLCPLTVSTLQTRSLPGDKQKLMRAALRSSEPQPSFSLWKSLPSSYNQMDFNVLTHPFQQRKMLNIQNPYTSISRTFSNKINQIKIEGDFQLIKLAQPVSAAALKQSVIPGS